MIVQPQREIGLLSWNSICHWLKRHKVILLLLLVIVVGSFLRIYNLGTESIWLDEAASINCSSKDANSIIESAGPTQNHPPFYFLILHFWMGLLGTSEVATRSLSAVFGIISILLLYQVGITLFNRRVGLIGSFLSAISYYHIYYSQETRSYSLLLLLSLLSYLFFIKILKKEKNWYYPCYFLANVLLGYTHLYGLFIIASQVFFFLLFWSKYRQQRVKLLSMVVTTIIALSPLVLLLGRSVAKISESGFWIKEPMIIDVLSTLQRFAGSGAGRTLLLFSFTLLALFGFFSIRKLEGKWAGKNPLESLKGLTWNVRFESIEEELLLIIWLSFSVVIPFIESKFMTPIYLTRYMTGASPAFYLLVARGMGKINMKRVFYPILIFIIVLSSLGLYQYYTNDIKNQWREVATFIETNSKDSDVIVFCAPYVQNPFDYYYTGGLQKFGIAKALTDTQQISTLLENEIREKDRLWLVLSHGGQDSPVHRYLERYDGGSIVIEKKFIGILVLLFDLSDQ
jgi:mannosyltransferase